MEYGREFYHLENASNTKGWVISSERQVMFLTKILNLKK